jgi:hypothetical protein
MRRGHFGDRLGPKGFGYRLQKLRGDDGYWLSDADGGWLVVGEEVIAGVRIGYDLDVIEEWLRS